MTINFIIMYDTVMEDKVRKTKDFQGFRRRPAKRIFQKMPFYKEKFNENREVSQKTFI